MCRADTNSPAETKWIDVSPSSPVAPVDGGKTWEEVPAVPTDVSPASSSSWADYVASTPAADSCVISVITKYGKPTWTPESDAPATWVDAAVPSSSVPATWVDAAVPSSSAPATWVDAAIPSSSVPATWADSPAPSDPAVWSDCGVPKTVTEEVTITYTVTDDGHWSDVAVVTSTDSVADYTWVDIPSEPTKPSSDDEKPVYGGHGKPSSDKPVHGGHGGKPTTTTTATTTTTPAVETETKTWGDADVSSKTTTVPTKETTTTWSKPSKPTDPVKDIPTTTKPTSGEETQAYW